MQFFRFAKCLTRNSWRFSVWIWILTHCIDEYSLVLCFIYLNFLQFFSNFEVKMNSTKEVERRELEGILWAHTNKLTSRKWLECILLIMWLFNKFRFLFHRCECSCVRACVCSCADTCVLLCQMSSINHAITFYIWFFSGAHPANLMRFAIAS